MSSRSALTRRREGRLASWKAGLGTCPTGSANLSEDSQTPTVVEREHHCAVKTPTPRAVQLVVFETTATPAFAHIDLSNVTSTKPIDLFLLSLLFQTRFR